MTKITTNLTINVRIFIINLFNYNSLLKTVTIYLYNKSFKIYTLCYNIRINIFNNYKKCYI